MRLPYLCSYNDILLEGLSHNLDEALLSPILLHLSSHLVRVRRNECFTALERRALKSHACATLFLLACQARMAVIKPNTKLRVAHAIEKACDDEDDEDEKEDDNQEAQENAEKGKAANRERVRKY